MPGESDIASRIVRFQKDLATLNDDTVFQKYIAFGDSYILPTELYFELKHDVSMKFGVHSTQVILVGSAKLGFSIAPDKRYQHFRDESDLDVAVISQDLFDGLWSIAFDYWNVAGDWYRGTHFRDYLFRGWVRPDYLPPDIQLANEWFEYFRQLTASQKFGPFKISAGVYKSWRFLERYQQIAIAQCRQSLRIENANDSN